MEPDFSSFTTVANSVAPSVKCTPCQGQSKKKGFEKNQSSRCLYFIKLPSSQYLFEGITSFKGYTPDVMYS